MKNILIQHFYYMFAMFFSLFYEIVRLHLTVTPSIGLENKHRISDSNAL